MTRTNDPKRTTFALVAFLALAGGGLSQAVAQDVTYKRVDTVQAVVPDGFMPCANDGQTCRLNISPMLDETKTLTIFYGVPGKYIVIQGTSPPPNYWALSSFVCLPGTFGVPDPATNVRKACWVFAGYPYEADTAAGSPDGTIVGQLPSGLTNCADDFQTCPTSKWWNDQWSESTKMWTGYYGARTSFVKISGIGDFTCSPASLGVPDPLENVKKSCYVRRYYRKPWRLASSNLPLSISATYALSFYEGQSWAIKFPIRPRVSVNNIPESNNIKLRGTISGPLPAGYALIIGNNLPPVSFAFTNDVRVSADNNAGSATFTLDSVSPSMTIIENPVLVQPPPTPVPSQP